MPAFIALVNWTEQGARNFKDSVARYEANSQQYSSLGVRFTNMYWTLGSYDMVCVVEGPDDESVAASLLAVCGQGNIKTQTMRGFTAAEMKAVLDKVP